METPEIGPEVKKKKRKYVRRGPVKMILDGKTYHGSKVSRDGAFLTLTGPEGYVLVNLAHAKVVEVTGKNPETISAAPVVPVEAGKVTGGMAAWKASRDRQLEGLTAMPGGLDAGN